MFRKVIVILAVVGLVHVSCGGPIDDLINELKPRVKEARHKVSAIVKDGGIAIGKTYASIERQISVLDKKLDDEENNLEVIVEQAKSDAKNSGKNIDACIEQEHATAKDLNRRDFELCRISQDLNALPLKIVEVAKLHIVLSKSIVTCVASSGSELDKIRTCVEKSVSDAEGKAEEVSREISLTAANAEKKAVECADRKAAEIETSIKKITEDFQDCVNKA